MLLPTWLWHQLGRFYDVLHSLGVAGCMLAVAASWGVSRWGLRLTLHHSSGDDRGCSCGGQDGQRQLPRPSVAPQLVFGCLLQIGGALLMAIAMVALVRTMVA